MNAVMTHEHSVTIRAYKHHVIATCSCGQSFTQFYRDGGFDVAWQHVQVRGEFHLRHAAATRGAK